jgi:tetratricopeptide (TPR) repeat protein
MKSIFSIITYCLLFFGTTGFTQSTIDSLKLSLEFEKNPEKKVEILIKLSEQYFEVDTAKSLDLAKEALKISREEKLQKGILLAMRQYVDIYIVRNEFETALDLAEKSIEIARESGTKEELANVLYRFASVYNNLGNYDKGSDYYFESLKLYEQTGDKIGIGKSLNGIGVIYYEQMEYDKALEYFYKSLNLAKEEEDYNGVSIGLNNVAIVFEDREEYNAARQYFEQALKINLKLDYKKGIGINYMNLGLTNQKLKNYKIALDYFQKAYDVLTELNHNRLLATCQVYMGKYYLETGNPELSLNYAKLAYEQGLRNESKKVIFQSLELFHDNYLKKNDTANAYKYAMLMFQAKDSLDLEENINELSRLELVYEFEKKENLQKVNQQRKDFIKLIIIISLIFSLVVVLLLFARNKIKAKAELLAKQKLERELELKNREVEFKNKELASNVMHQMQNNELISGLSNKLIEIEKKAVKEETKEALDKIAAELNKSTEHDLWEDFEVRFKKVHSNFYEKLIQLYPDLSPNELRLCAFLRLNMSTKEISELTGQRTRTIETARTRLRKKMGISNSEINLIAHLTRIN